MIQHSTRPISPIDTNTAEMIQTRLRMPLSCQTGPGVDEEERTEEETAITQADGEGSCRNGRKLMGLRSDAYPIRNRSRVRVQVSAVNKLSTTPIPSVAANPLTRPVPRKNSAEQLIRVVR